VFLSTRNVGQRINDSIFCPLGFSRFLCLSLGTAKNLPQFACYSLSDALSLNRLTHGSKVKEGFRFLVFSQNSTFPTSAFSFPYSSDLALGKSVRHVRAFGGGRNFEKYGLNLGFTQTWVWGKLGFETCPNLNLERFDGLEILSPNRSGEFGI
jgi:hypothetical protein